MMSIGAFYSQTSSFQDRMWGHLMELASQVVPDRGLKTSLIDLGCGPGTRTRDCLSVFPRLERMLGIDVDSSMIAEALRSTQYPGIELKIHDIADLHTLPPEQFDVVVSNWVLHWVRDKDLMFDSLNGLSKDQTVILIGTCERLPEILVDLDALVREHLKPETALSLYYHTREDWVKLAERHGWRVIGERRHREKHAVAGDGTYLRHWHAASCGKSYYGHSIEELGPEFMEHLRKSLHARYATPDGKEWEFFEDVLFLALQRSA